MDPSSVITTDLPVALRTKGQNKLQNGVLHVPAVQDSDLPGLMGLTALKSNKAILDFNTLTLYFCHNANYDLDKTLPEGTNKYQLETAPSGHLVLPCCEYKMGSCSNDFSLTLMTETAQPSNTGGQEKVPEEQEGQATPPVRSPSVRARETVVGESRSAVDGPDKVAPPPDHPSGLRRERGRHRSRTAQQSRK